MGRELLLPGQLPQHLTAISASISDTRSAVLFSDDSVRWVCDGSGWRRRRMFSGSSTTPRCGERRCAEMRVKRGQALALSKMEGSERLEWQVRWTTLTIHFPSEVDFLAAS